MRGKRGEFFFDFADRVVFLRALAAGALLFFLLVSGFAGEDDDD
jgi:hypothetical protein